MDREILPSKFVRFRKVVAEEITDYLILQYNPPPPFPVFLVKKSHDEEFQKCYPCSRGVILCILIGDFALFLQYFNPLEKAGICVHQRGRSRKMQKIDISSKNTFLNHLLA